VGQIYFSTGTKNEGIYQWYDGSSWKNLGGYKVSVSTIYSLNSENKIYFDDELRVPDAGITFEDGEKLQSYRILLQGKNNAGTIEDGLILAQDFNTGGYGGLQLAVYDDIGKQTLYPLKSYTNGGGSLYNFWEGANYIYGNNTGNYTLYVSTASDGNIGNFVVKNNGNVGIGTSNPSNAVLDVAGGVGDYGAVIEKRLSVRHLDGKNWDTNSVADGDLYLQSGVNYNTILNYNSSGNVGIKDNTPSYTLDVTGDIHCTGKLTSDGGNDPPYVLYNYETRKSIIERVKKEVTLDKLNGAVLFYNGEASRMELFLPSKGEFRDLFGKVLASTTSIINTFEVEDKYYFDDKEGKIKAIKVPKKKAKYKIKEGIKLDNKTGIFYKEVKENKIIIPKEEAIEKEE